MKGTLGYKIRTIRCIGCGTERTGHLRPAQTYCSLACYRRSQRPARKTGATLTCEECSEAFYVPRNRVGKAQFCSRDCHAEYQRRTRPSDKGIVANMRAAQRKQLRSHAPTQPERDLYALLDDLAVTYERQYVIATLFTVDACIPDARLILQADGDYWHGRLGLKDKRVRNRVRLDRSQNSYAANHGWDVLRLWGSDLADRPDWCREQISQRLRPPFEAPR